LKLHVVPNNGDRHFVELFNVRRKKSKIYFMIIPAIKALPKEPLRHTVYSVCQHQLLLYH